MSESRSASSQSRRNLVVMVIIMVSLFGAVAAYVLGIGPAAMLAQNDVLNLEAVTTFYYPLIWLHDHTPLRTPLEWYVGFWE